MMQETLKRLEISLAIFDQPTQIFFYSYKCIRMNIHSTHRS